MVMMMSKEKFRDKRWTQLISITYKDEDGINKRWDCNQIQLIKDIQEIVNHYLGLNIKLTLRQIYYRLVGNDVIPNAIEIYKRIGSVITDMRYNGLIDWDAMEDRARTIDMASEWDNARDLMNSAVASFRLPRWKDQDTHVELFSEKDAVFSVVQPLSRKYHVRLNINKGYNSASNMYELSKRLADKLVEGKPVVLLYLGDHDASGLDMIRDIKERVQEFLEGGHEYIYPQFRIIPVALTMAQIKKFKLPPNPAKVTDPRAKWYIKQHGSTSWELDALKPEIMQGIVDKAIVAEIDLDRYNAWKVKEMELKGKLQKFAETLVKPEADSNDRPYKFDEQNTRTRVKVYSDVEVIHKKDEEDKEYWNSRAYGQENKVLYLCPICNSDYPDRDGAFNCVFEYHGEDEFDERYNPGDE